MEPRPNMMEQSSVNDSSIYSQLTRIKTFVDLRLMLLLRRHLHRRCCTSRRIIIVKQGGKIPMIDMLWALLHEQLISVVESA